MAGLVMAFTAAAGAQWQMQESHTDASLRGIHALGGGVAWASGSKGTVRRTVDGGKTWEVCAVPEGAEKLDFRGVQGFDAKTAIVMSSGKGDLSRLYKTKDGCKSWKLAKINPDAEGFWDSIQAENAEHAYILGDSVAGQVRIWEWKEGWEERELELTYEVRGGWAEPGEGSFAASNSVLQIVKTDQADKRWKYLFRWTSETPTSAYMTIVHEQTGSCEPCVVETAKIVVPLSTRSATSGVYSFAFRSDLVGVAVGGDYSKPDATVATSATTTDGGFFWHSASQPPHGYRSAVAYDEKKKFWMTVGPNGTDVSTDDGWIWKALMPGAGDAPDADKNWNALSLPFVVGSKGRIGILRDGAVGAK